MRMSAKKIRNEMKSILRDPTVFNCLSLKYKMKLIFFFIFEK